ncbi:MAG TPA: protein kinase [Kofleriaceae bacterium]|nr:protein kinase [Kofleriaceae bacterium]
METDPTQMSLSGEKHPTLAELREASHPSISEHLASCAMCRSVISADDHSAPIPLDLPKGLVTENAFKWPADPIARGGMAQIFVGEDKRLGRRVILKAPREDEGLAPGMAEMFQRRVTAEARILAKLQHPSIVTIHELGKSTVGWPFCVLERVEGTSLRDRLDELAEREQREGKPLTRERLELLSSLVSIAEALAYAHERRIVHRDCTPNNILLGKRGEATLIDWGIARDLDAPALTDDAATINDQPPSMSGRMVTISAGTPPYLPLEQTQGRQADPSFDVYSFGITLYEVVSGRTPFEWRAVEGPERAKQLLAFLDWLKGENPPPPAMEKDPELSGIISRAMAHDPAHRFTSDELVLALKQYLHGDLVFSHRYSLTGRIGRWARRHRAATVAMISVLVFVIGGAVVWAQLQRSARDAAEMREKAQAARAEAAESKNEADAANREADAAKALADEAERRGANADELRKKADRLRAEALDKKKRAEVAEKEAKATADEAKRGTQEALKQKQEAERLRDEARAAQTAAEQARDAAIAARQAADEARAVADKERDAARSARTAAERERDAARSAQSEAEKAREAAREGQSAAEKERDAAVAARVAVERERDEARRRVLELEQKLRDRGGPDGPPPPPPGP